MDIKLFDSELKVMSVLWRDGDVPAKYIHLYHNGRIYAKITEMSPEGAISVE